MTEQLLGALIRGAGFEVIPLPGILDKTRAIAPGPTISITASPSRGATATVDLALELREDGHSVAPHLSARMIEDRRELSAIIERLDHAGVRQVFVVAGDGEPRGEYFDALSLLRDMAELGHPFTDVGIAGYPEGHPAISEGALRAAMSEKQVFATYLVTQMCFDAQAIVDWVSRIRADGVELPVIVGIPGAVDAARLLTISARIGVGDSARFLAKNRRAVLRFLRPGRYRPDGLLKSLAEKGDGLGLNGTHIFTFNQVAPTVDWHRRALERLV